MIEIQSEKKYIRLRNLLLHLSNVVEIDNSQNMNNINILLEKVFCGLLNIVHDDTNYENLNTYKDKNYPGVDLGDHTCRKYFQVTSTPTQKKVDESYKVFLENKTEGSDVYSLQFLILKINARKSPVKHPKTYSAKQILFNPKTDYLDLGKLLNIINQLEEKKVDECIEYLEGIVRDNPIQSTDTDTVILKAFFSTLSSLASDEDTGLPTILSQDEINIKQQRLGDFWRYVYGCYQTLIVPSQEKRFKSAYNHLDEGARIAIERFLKQNSYSILEKNPDPERAFKVLNDFILSKLNHFPISHSELEQYLCMEIVFCNVFPNPVELAA